MHGVVVYKRQTGIHRERDYRRGKLVFAIKCVIAIQKGKFLIFHCELKIALFHVDFSLYILMCFRIGNEEKLLVTQSLPRVKPMF
jgi:hypothetical protein